MPSLDGPRFKCERAKEHLDNLTAEIAAYYSRKPYALIRDVHPDGPARQVLRWKVHEEPPIRLGVILGDAVHNMRSGLDHLAFQLALIDYPTLTPDEERRIEFPIYKDIREFNSRGLPRIQKVPSRAQDEIEALQPYHRGHDADAHLLWLLHVADIIDKHRQIVPRRPAHKLLIRIEGKDFLITGPFNDGDVVGFISKRAHSKQDFQPPFAPEIMFDIGGPRPLAHADFYTMHEFITDSVLPRFTRFFA